MSLWQADDCNFRALPRNTVSRRALSIQRQNIANVQLTFTRRAIIETFEFAQLNNSR